MNNQETTPLPYTIAYEDASLLIIDKPQGLATTPGLKPSLCAALFLQQPGLKNVQGYREGEGGLLNRLDNETGGLVFFAKTDAAFSAYSRLMADDKIEKKYLAIIKGALIPEQGCMDQPIGHSGKSSKRMIVKGTKQKIRGKWQQALTRYCTLERKGGFSLLELTITRGVRHQIRVHLHASGCPVSGDKLYSADNGYQVYPYHLLYAYCARFVNSAGILTEVKVQVPFLEMWQNNLISAGH